MPVSESNPFSVTITGATTNAMPDNWPFVTCGFAIAWVTTRMTQDPPKTILAHKNWFIHQGLLFTSNNGRESNHNAMTSLRALNPELIIVIHKDIHGVQIGAPSGYSTPWMEDLVFADTPGLGFDGWIGQVTNAAGADWFSRAEHKEALKFDWNAPQAAMDIIGQRFLDDFSDFDGLYNCARDFQCGLMHDTMSLKGSPSNIIPVYQQDSLGSPSSTEIDIPTWTNPPTIGSPDGSGYFSLDEQHHCIAIHQNRDAGDESAVTGLKTINGSTDRLRLASPINFSLSSGSHTIFVRRNAASPRTSGGEISGEAQQEGCIRLLQAYRDALINQHGVTTDIYINGAGKNWADKWQLVDPDIPFGFPGAIGKYGGMHWEHAEEMLGFHTANQTDYFQNGAWGYKVERVPAQVRTATYNPDALPPAIATSRPLLLENGASVSGYPTLWLNVNVRSFGNSNVSSDETNIPGSGYDELNELDAAFVRFWSCFAWCCENVAPQAEVRPAHDMPVMIDEEIVSAGDPITPRDFWENYDPDGDAGKGTYDWKTPAFGTHGYFFEFDNCLIQINLRAPDDLTALWIPSWMVGGQTINPALDRGTLPSAGAGKKWQAFNRATYVNPDASSKFFNSSAADLETLPGSILFDNDLNDGADRGATFDTGPLEAVIHLRVNT